MVIVILNSNKSFPTHIVYILTIVTTIILQDDNRIGASGRKNEQDINGVR